MMDVLINFTSHLSVGMCVQRIPIMFCHCGKVLPAPVESSKKHFHLVESVVLWILQFRQRRAQRSKETSPRCCCRCFLFVPATENKANTCILFIPPCFSAVVSRCCALDSGGELIRRCRSVCKPPEIVSVPLSTTGTRLYSSKKHR